jgi:hypothetical protein
MQRHDEINARTGIWSVSDDVSRANNLLTSLLLDVFEHVGESLKVPVDVADNGSTHSVGSSAKNSVGEEESVKSHCDLRNWGCP